MAFVVIAYSLAAIAWQGITRGLTSTGLTLSAADATFGGEHQVALFVTATQAAGAVVPTGSFTITDESGNQICAGQLDSTGTAACVLNDNQLHPGDHTLTANYAGDSNYTGSSSAGQDFFVFRAGTTTTVTLPATAIAFDEEGGLLMNFQVTSNAGGPAHRS